MDDPRTTPQPEKRKLRGLYQNVNISVKALDRIIIVCAAAILILVALNLRKPGFLITFDTRGGTDVPAQTQMYGELLEVPDPPTREGYVFTGWYTDTACQTQWNVDTMIIETDMNLYAGWEKIE